MPNLQKRLLLLASTSTLALITACGGGSGGNNVRPDVDDPLARTIPSAEELGVIDSAIDNGAKTFFTAPTNPEPTSGSRLFSAQQLRFDMNQWYAENFDGSA